ncbi:DnaJ domain chaperone [Metarhizium robertsii]|uniref:Heat shock protein DnaJ n=2 Tax=Metarhizium robertsii TaxID=568076 RepID=E9ETH9_METRA|nr:Heat shock protein DnaJ [Metarhizium robertsii ARSEF 23]EFZ00732.1 Heat shock protein DnaJ [Metarhizium robertsii ARSEF 23]EXV03243.1 DnaJ domain chaperone [Metarhizium robertsii]
MSSLPPDPYKILGVSKDAQTSEIRSAHRKLVLKCHPDKVQDPALKAEKQDEFQKVQQAYELLTNDRERQKYDDKAKLEELRKQFQAQANISTPRSTRYSGPDEARGTESRASPFKASVSPSGVKYSYNGLSDEDLGRGPRIFEASPRSSRREASYEKASERRSDREREREKEQRDRERRRQQEDALKRAEKEAKEARRAEKRAREKQNAKDMKRQSEEKKRHAKPYIEPFDEEPTVVRSDKKKSSGSRNYDEKRDRSSGRDDIQRDAHPPRPQRSWTAKEEYAHSYIKASKAKSTPGLKRAATTHYIRSVQPPAPTPPPIHGQSGPFAPPDDDDARRSSARPRRGSGDDPRLSRERSYRTPSRDAMDDPPIINVSPSARHTAAFFTPSSPPRGDRLPRTKTMPHESVSYSRSPPEIQRSQTFHMFESADHPRGRDRSRMQSQVELEMDDEDRYDRRRDRKHRSRRRHHSPDPMRTENVSRYRVERNTLDGAYNTRLVEPDIRESYASYYHPQDSRPSMPGRETSYSNSGGANFPKVKTTKAYGYEDVSYSTYGRPAREFVYST